MSAKHNSKGAHTMTPEEIIELSNEFNKIGRSSVARFTLSSLRHLRDNHPTEWDALTKADNNAVICTLWAYLKGECS